MIRIRNHNPSAGHKGFTLLEVLMAAIIISLGVLGITALFAGAARQQQIASEMTRSVISSKNAEAIIAPTFGQLAASEPDILADFYPPDQWVPVFMERDDHYLTTADPDIFFLVRPPLGFPVEVYDWRSTGADYTVLRGLNSHNSMRQYIRYFQDLPSR
ncbi:MAG: prepilin-type N-terminal cleavage/methylation domain-containing protein, partial [Phycisphaerales bacterium]|nr:prepilin-type N-terminal cleavage/methylation domain-containing protein [Phycisphaerales bacterium]